MEYFSKLWEECDLRKDTEFFNVQQYFLKVFPFKLRLKFVYKYRILKQLQKLQVFIQTSLVLREMIVKANSTSKRMKRSHFDWIATETVLNNTNNNSANYFFIYLNNSILFKKIWRNRLFWLPYFFLGGKGVPFA